MQACQTFKTLYRKLVETFYVTCECKSFKRYDIGYNNNTAFLKLVFLGTFLGNRWQTQTYNYRTKKFVYIIIILSWTKYSLTKYLIEIGFDRQIGKSETCHRRLIINDDGMGIHENCILNFFCTETLPQDFLFVHEIQNN